MKAVIAISLTLVATPAYSKCLHLSIATTEIAMTAPGGRTVPVTIIGPIKPGRYPLIAFSHGAYAAPSRYRAMLDPIAAAGYVIVAPMHVDSELMPHDKPPSQQFVWQSRNEDMALALAATPANINPKRRAAMGHSYGALIAQVAAGAIPVNAPERPRLLPQTLVAWSPPGPSPILIEAKGWSSISTPSLTITGTSDILPPFIDHWELHRAAHDNTPKGKRWLWVGAGINHYFGGMFGRVKEADPASKRLFDRAITTVIAFLGKSFGRSNGCNLGSAISGEMLDIDK
jgi:dienelactone hydrolase